SNRIGDPGPSWNDDPENGSPLPSHSVGGAGNSQPGDRTTGGYFASDRLGGAGRLCPRRRGSFAARQSPPSLPAQAASRLGEAGGGDDFAHQASGRHPLEYSHLGPAFGVVPHDGASGLAGERVATPSGGNL